MTQRTLAGLLAVPLLIGLWTAAQLEPLPYVTYEPGLTVDVLGETKGKEIIQVEGHETYRDDGQLRMTTVYVSQPDARVNLFELMHGWLSREDAVYPYKAVYRPDETTEENRREGAVEMVSSQDAAIAVGARRARLRREARASRCSAWRTARPPTASSRCATSSLAVDGKPVTGRRRRRRRGPGHARGAAGDLRRTPGRRAAHGRGDAGGAATASPRSGIQLGTGYEFPFDVLGQHRPEHRRAQRRADVLARHLRHPDPGLADRRRGRRRHRHHRRPTARSGRSAASSRRSSAPATPAPRSSWCRPTTAQDAAGAPNGDMRLVRADDHARRRRRHRDLGRRPRRRPADL